jgi:transporter family-2 protein
MKFFTFAFVAAAGVMQSFQGGMNSKLRKVVGDPWVAGLWVVGLELAVFGLAALIVRPKLPSWAEMTSGPWWAYIGGILGCSIVYAGLDFAAKLGAGPFNGIIVTSSIIASLLLDNFGLVGFEQHPVNLWRIMGGALMIGGVTLIAIF